MSNVSGTSQEQGQKKIVAPRDIYKKVNIKTMTEEEKKALREELTKTDTTTSSSH